jgi:hypothetical protein
MFTWLSRLCTCHFNILNPNFPTGYYTGIGRALHLIEQDKQKTKNEDSEGEDD